MWGFMMDSSDLMGSSCGLIDLIILVPQSFRPYSPQHSLISVINLVDRSNKFLKFSQNLPKKFPKNIQHLMTNVLPAKKC